MARQDTLNDTPFNSYICLGCGKPLGKHWLYRPDSFGDVRGATKRKPNGRLYCNRDGLGWSKNHYQRELRRIAEPGYMGSAG